MELYKTVKTTAPFISSEEWCVQKISQQIREDELGFSAVECFYCWSRLTYPWKEGDFGGYPIPQYRKKYWQIPKYCVKNRPNTDTTVMIGHVYLKLYPSRVFVYLNLVCTRATSDIASNRSNQKSFEKTSLRSWRYCVGAAAEPCSKKKGVGTRRLKYRFSPLRRSWRLRRQISLDYRDFKIQRRDGNENVA